MADNVVVEIGWTPKGKPHVIARYPSGKPKTACGRILSGLADTRHTSPNELGEDMCRQCVTSAHVHLMRATVGFKEIERQRMTTRSCGCPKNTDYRIVNRTTGQRAEAGDEGAITVCAGCGKEIEL